jgi:acyl dehydratase
MHYPEILDIRPEPYRNAYDDQDVILYALGIGFGENPLDPQELRFVYEKSLVAMPTLAVMLGGGSGGIIADGGLDFPRIVHGEQRLEIHHPLPTAASLISGARCLGVVDKGAEHGALLNIETTIADADSGIHYATATSTLFCRGDGGFGGPTEGALLPHPVPGRPHDREVAIPTRPGQALLYRLNGDRNPLHCDPEAAAQAGFPAPILHGLCTYGITCRAVLRAWCDNDPARIAAFDVRFSSPVYPGETIVTRMWRDGATIAFEAHVAERNVRVIRNGRCVLRS